MTAVPQLSDFPNVAPEVPRPLGPVLPHVGHGGEDLVPIIGPDHGGW